MKRPNSDCCSCLKHSTATPAMELKIPRSGERGGCGRVEIGKRLRWDASPYRGGSPCHRGDGHGLRAGFELLVAHAPVAEDVGAAQVRADRALAPEVIVVIAEATRAKHAHHDGN